MSYFLHRHGSPPVRDNTVAKTNLKSGDRRILGPHLTELAQSLGCYELVTYGISLKTKHSLQKFYIL